MLEKLKARKRQPELEPKEEVTTKAPKVKLAQGTSRVGTTMAFPPRKAAKQFAAESAEFEAESAESVAEEASRMVLVIPPAHFMAGAARAAVSAARAAAAPLAANVSTAGLMSAEQGPALGNVMGGVMMAVESLPSGTELLHDIMSGARAAMTPIRRLLEEQRAGLQAFMDFARRSARGVSRARAMAAEAVPPGMMAVTSVAGTEPHAAEPQMLEGLGAWLVDRRTMDVTAMAATTGAQVLENVLIPLEQPVRRGAPAAALPTEAAARWHLKSINVDAARKRKLTGKGVRIGIVDTGIQADHPEFAGRDVKFARFDMNGNTVSTTPHDVGEHGTHVSGIAAGKNVGVAPEADLAVAAVLTYRTANGQLAGYLTQIAKGINWLITELFDGPDEEAGVDVINASLGGTGYTDYYYTALAAARLNAGTVMAAAIGNAGPAANQHGSPGNYDIVEGVGAIDSANNVALFSDWGTVTQHPGITKPDLSAPGVDVWSSLPGSRYGKMSGTSMASPVVAGSLALLLQETPAFMMDAAGLLAKLQAMARPLKGAANQRRGGRGRLSF